MSRAFAKNIFTHADIAFHNGADFRHIDNAARKDFSNKIRRLIKQAYGFRDDEYFRLKIHQLQEISSAKGVCVMSNIVEEAEKWTGT